METTTAATRSYGATAYFRSVSNNVTTMFILTKSRLAPLQERLLTIPKLELQAAVIAARIKETVLHEISFHPRAIFKKNKNFMAPFQGQYFFGLTQKLTFNIFKMKRVTSQYLLCITLMRLDNFRKFQTGIISLVNKIHQTCAQEPRQLLN